MAIITQLMIIKCNKFMVKFKEKRWKYSNLNRKNKKRVILIKE